MIAKGFVPISGIKPFAIMKRISMASAIATIFTMLTRTETRGKGMDPACENASQAHRLAVEATIQL